MLYEVSAATQEGIGLSTPGGYLLNWVRRMADRRCF